MTKLQQRWFYLVVNFFRGFIQRKTEGGIPRLAMRRAEGVLKIMFKTKEALIPYLLLAAAVAGGLLWHESEILPQLGQTIVSGQIAVGGPYALTDQDGNSRSSTDFRGKYQMIYFGYSFLPRCLPHHLGVMAAGDG